jgi:hypothetical protein
VKIILTTLVLGVCSSLTAAHAATVEFSGDAVVGVSGLEFLDAEYDAIFYDGSYEDLLTYYPPSLNVTDYGSSFATAANAALHDFVVSDAFDGIAPGDINGCSHSTLCYIATAVEQDPAVAAFIEYRAIASPDSGFSDSFAADDRNYEIVSWVVWQGSDLVNPVPVPAAVWLFGSALGLLGWARRKSPI